MEKAGLVDNSWGELVFVPGDEALSQYNTLMSLQQTIYRDTAH